MTTATKGLAGVIAADTRISRVDGEKGELIYRGYNILDIGEATSFEEVIYLLWHGDLPNEAQLATFQSQLVARRTVDPGARGVAGACGVTERALPVVLIHGALRSRMGL